MRISTKVTQLFVLGAGAAALLSADSLTLRSGQVVQGTFIGGTARQIRMDLNGETRSYDITDIVSIAFSDSSAQSAPPPRYPSTPSYPATPSYPSSASSNGAPRLRRAPGSDSDVSSTSVPPPPPPPVASSGITIPVDTTVTVRMIDAVDSEKVRLGQTFRASLDEGIFVNGQEVVPRGADVLTKLVEDQQSGKIEGRTKLTLALSTITVNGRPVDVTSTDVTQQSASRGARTGKVVGGTAALGAIIGAIAGGGKGAAIGAGSGAAVGAGAEVLTAGQKVKIPSETRLVFRLQSPAQL